METTPDPLEFIMTRRSVRQYTDEPVAEASWSRVLRAGMQAPSAGNQQPWQFVVVEDRAVLDAFAGQLPYGKMLKGAPMAIVVAVDTGLVVKEDYWIQDASACLENMLLAAHALGLGAVWVGLFPKEERLALARDLLGIPAAVVPVAIVPLGHPAQRQEPVDRYHEDRVHRGRW